MLAAWYHGGPGGPIRYCQGRAYIPVLRGGDPPHSEALAPAAVMGFG